MIVRKSNLEEVSKLTAISKGAFDTDINVGSSEIGGPPFYDSVNWHRRMLKSGNLYTVEADGAVIGGAVLFHDKKDPAMMYVGRIFIEPELHNQGYGLQEMKLIEELFPEITTWRLETPIWNVRTNRFYLKAGYTKMMEDKESCYYQKIV